MFMEEDEEDMLLADPEVEEKLPEPKQEQKQEEASAIAAKAVP